MDNVYAWRLGEALTKAETQSYGDLIDRGLALFNEIDKLGFEITVKRSARMSIMHDEPLNNGPSRYKGKPNDQ